MDDNMTNVPTPEPTPQSPETNSAPEPMPMPTPVSVPETAPLPPHLAPMSSAEMAATIMGAIFLSPAVPLILWIVWNQTFPTKGKQAIKVLWIFVALYLFIVCCSIAVVWALGFAAIDGMHGWS